MGSITNINNGHYVVAGDHITLYHKLDSEEFIMKCNDRSVFKIKGLAEIIDALIIFEEYLTREGHDDTD